jgi:glycopeptide antibiotics resistance protein
MGAKVIRIFFTPAPLKPKSLLLWWWVALLVTIPTFPLSDFVGHSHWDKVRWIPFQDFSFSAAILVDLVGNLGWFLVFGYLLQYRKEDRSIASIHSVVVTAAIVSLLLEGFQVYCHNRIPSMTDVVCNIVGATIGASVARTHRPTPILRGHNLVLEDSD